MTCPRSPHCSLEQSGVLKAGGPSCPPADLTMGLSFFAVGILVPRATTPRVVFHSWRTVPLALCPSWQRAGMSVV